MNIYYAKLTGRVIYFEALSLDQAMLKMRGYQKKHKVWRRLRTVAEAYWYSAELNGPLTDMDNA